MSYSAMYEQCMEKFNGAVCTDLALYTIKKRGETVKGIQYLQRACKLDNPRGCTILGNIFKEGKKACEDPFLAKRYYDKACRLGSEIACESYNNYRPKTVYEWKEIDEVMAEMFDVEIRKHRSMHGCKCKPTKPEKKECVDHSAPEG